jgi:hypothetical protein
LSQKSRGLHKNKILRVDAFHPNNMTVKHKEYYNQIIILAKNYSN